jgi:proteic killer suppression protein
MIRSFRHKGLRRFYQSDDRSKLPPELVERIRSILSAIDEAKVIGDMALPTLKLHALKGDRKGLWAVTVRANWRIVFRFAGGNAFDVDFEDYH